MSACSTADLQRDVGSRQCRQLVDQRERLAGRQTDDPRQLQLGLLGVVLCGGGALTLRTDLQLCAQHVDAGDEASGLQIGRLR